MNLIPLEIYPVYTGSYRRFCFLDRNGRFRIFSTRLEAEKELRGD